MSTYKERQARVYAEYGKTKDIPFPLKYYARYYGDKPPVPTSTKNRASSTSTNPFRIGNPFKLFGTLQNWRDDAIYESAEMTKPHTQANIERHKDAVEYINDMNAIKLGTMSSKNVAKLAHAMAQNKARHRASTIRASTTKGGGKKKSRKSRKTRRNPIHK
jgi:hypothetical protein